MGIIALAKKWSRPWESAMRSLKSSDQIKVDRMIGVYTGPRAYHFSGLDVLPVEVFLEELHRGNIF